MEDSGRDLYELLGVAQSATADDLRTAYRAWARRTHPDVAGSSAAGDMAMINEAWAILGDPHRRAAYDRSLGSPSPSAQNSVDHDGEPDETRDRQPAAFGRPAQRLLKALLLASLLALLVLTIAIFLIGFGRVGA